MLHELWAAKETERRSLASDLHDGPAQTLLHVTFQLQTARRQIGTDSTEALATLEQAEAAVRDTLAQVRAIMSGLRPMAVTELGLVSALRSECDAIAARGRVRIGLRVTGTPRDLDEARETDLYRVIREALSNVERHSGADRAELDIEYRTGGVTARVTDAGRGFDGGAERAARRAGRMGLPTMRERVEAMGGRMHVDAAPGGGARITFECPYDTRNARRDRAGDQR
jgi:signal transduction histidine kinase